MAYDPVKAHEYYEKYVKNGLKKGRKKSSDDTKKKTSKKGSAKKKTAKSSLIGFSTSGLNDQGKIEATLAKERITNEMNEALSKATTAEEKEKIRREYSQKGIDAVNKLKNDPKYATEKKTSTKSSSGSSKSSSGSTKSSSGSSKSSSSSTKSSGSGSSKSTSSTSTESAKMLENAASVIEGIKTMFSSMTEAEKTETKKKITDFITQLRNRSTNLTKSNILSQLQQLSQNKTE